MTNKDKEFIDLKRNSNFSKLYKTVVAQLGHDQYTAIGDLTDNCIDAEADKIDITLYEKKGGLISKIMIRDNGKGMTRNVIASCQSFANDNPHSDDDCGFFGVGGTSASMFLGKRKTVISKTPAGIFKSVLAPFEAQSDNDMAWFEDVSEADAEILHDHPTGTAIIIEELNTFSVNKVGSYFTKLRDYLAETFRIRVINIDINLKVIDQNCQVKKTKKGEMIECIRGSDPLFRNKEEMHLIEKREFDFPIKLPCGGESIVKLCLTGFHKTKFQSETGHKLTYSESGVYVLRNNRQIIAGKSIAGIFNNHPTNAGMRFEISYHSEVEQTGHIKVNTQKSSIQLSESLIDRMKLVIGPFRNSYGPAWDKARGKGVASPDKDIQDQIETLEKAMKKMPGALGIKHKTKDPTGDGPYRQSPHNPGPDPKDSHRTGRTRKKREIDLPFTIKLMGYEYVDKPFFLEPPTLDSEDKYVIVLNTESRWYKDSFKSLDNNSRRQILFILYALNMTLTVRDTDHNYDAIDNFVEDVSRQLEAFVTTLSSRRRET